MNIVANRSLRMMWTAVFAPALAASALAAPAPPESAFFTNSLGMEFVRVEPVTFKVEAGADYADPVAREVTLTKPYYILKNKVVQAEYEKSGLRGKAGDVSWNNAAAFCEWLSRCEQRLYRLPTEAEWLSVFQHRRGVEGMTGREWVQDWHGSLPPDSPANPAGPATGTTKVIRDGARRFSLPPDASSAPWELEATGFRVVLVVGPAEEPACGPPPFSQAAIKQNTKAVRLGPDPKTPYFKVRFALPIPPENATNLTGSLAGIDAAVMAHQHSPGFEILPNGDALAIWFSARSSKGDSECDPGTRFVQARLRFGAEEWDPPELFCDFKRFNDQSALLWTEGNRVWFFGGGREASAWMPFKVGISTNNGATWNVWLPLLDAPAKDFTPQPIVNAFRARRGGAMFFAMDGEKNTSFLWRSLDNGIHWHDMGGRTGGRHSTIVPLDAKGHLLAIGGKSTSVNGWSPQSLSSDWGASWSESQPSAFPALAGNQRPCLIRLANGHLCFVSDSYKRPAGAPAGWSHGAGCNVAISTDNGKQWRIKRLPVELPHESDRRSGTVGYATVRQAPNGVIHVLSTMTHPGLHYEFNEAWVLSDAGEVAADTGGGRLHRYRESYPGGTVRAVWSARICRNGSYLLEGTETTYYRDGRKEHEAAYAKGRKTGLETFWAPDGTRLWTWTHEPEKNRSTWTQYWRSGGKRIESQWNTQPRARDIDREFCGLVADGPARWWNQDGSPAGTWNFANGVLAGEPGPLSAPPASAAPVKGGSEAQ
jgi:hypothetical protein